MSYIATNLLIALLALLFERMFGYPGLLYKVVRHPVVWMGWLISLADRFLNKQRFSDETRRLNGALTLLLLLFLTCLISALLVSFARAFPAGPIVEAILASSFLAQKSLRDYVKAVREALAVSVEAGQEAVRHIVGRDLDELDESGIAKAAVESLAENTADGVIAPLFWMAILGLPGAALYKAINTADSMIGHRSEKYNAFGRVSAKLDDAVNYPAARLSGYLFALAAFCSRKWNGAAALQAMERDADKHLSPNAGFPEAAMAGGLGLQLGGTRSYKGRVVHLATMGDGRSQLTLNDIQDALKLYAYMLTLTALLLASIVFVFLILI